MCRQLSPRRLPHLSEVKRIVQIDPIRRRLIDLERLHKSSHRKQRQNQHVPLGGLRIGDLQGIQSGCRVNASETPALRQ